MKHVSKALATLIIFFISCAALALSPQVGDIAPSLSVASGDGKIMTLDNLRGKVVVMFYDSRDTVGRDAKLREVLNKFYDIQSDEKKNQVFKLAIIDCSSAFFPVDFIWKKKLVDASKSKQMDIYGDWNGKVADNYAFNLNDSNIVIIDRTGVIRYMSREEITDEKEINKIVAILNQIT